MPQASTPWMELFFVYYSLYRSMDWYAVHGVIDMASQSQPATCSCPLWPHPPPTASSVLILERATPTSTPLSSWVVPAFSVGESVSCRATTLCDGAPYLRPVSARTRLYFAHPNLFSTASPSIPHHPPQHTTPINTFSCRTYLSLTSPHHHKPPYLKDDNRNSCLLFPTESPLKKS